MRQSADWSGRYLAALEATGGSHTRACKVIGIAPKTASRRRQSDQAFAAAVEGIMAASRRGVLWSRSKDDHALREVELLFDAIADDDAHYDRLELGLAALDDLFRALSAGEDYRDRATAVAREWALIGRMEPLSAQSLEQRRSLLGRLVRPWAKRLRPWCSY